MMCQDMGMIAEKLIVLWPVYLGGRKSAPPAAFIPFYRLQPIGLKVLMAKVEGEMPVDYTNLLPMPSITPEVHTNTDLTVVMI